MPEYRVTFGSQYGSPDFGADPHPVGGHEFVHRDGWWTIVAPDEDHARTLAIAVTGNRYSGLYAAVNFHAARFPRGELLRLTHPAMATQAVALLEGDVPDTIHVYAGLATGRLLVTVWGNGSGEVAYRPIDDTRTTWGPPSTLTPAP